MRTYMSPESKSDHNQKQRLSWSGHQCAEPETCRKVSTSARQRDVTCALLRHGVSGLPYHVEEQRTELGLAGDIISLTLAWE